MPVTISTRTAPPARGAPGEIDSLFVIATDAGLTTAAAEPKLVRSIGDYDLLGATRVADPVSYDGLDNFFREGGRRAYVIKKAATTAATVLLIPEDLGGGQIVEWKSTPVPADQQVLATFARDSKRFALIDVPLTDDTVAKLTTSAGTLPANDKEHYAGFGPWVEIPAPAGVTGGSARQAPASSTVAALIARSDALGNPNRAPAGRDFALQYATGTVGPTLTDADATALRTAGLNPLRQKFGLSVLDGFQTKILTDPNNPFWQANCSRARNWLQWNCLEAGLNYEYKPIDGRGRLALGLKGDIEAICKSLWEADGLYGDNPSQAYAVEVGIAVNTEQTIAFGELHAVAEVRFSLHARTVIIELVTVPITGRVSA